MNDDRFDALLFLFPLFAALTFLAFVACGCATYSTEFIDVDKTTHRTDMAAFIVKLPVDDAGMDYEWRADGSGKIVEGRRVEGLDATEVAKLAEALAAAAAAVAAIGVLP